MPALERSQSEGFSKLEKFLFWQNFDILFSRLIILKHGNSWNASKNNEFSCKEPSNRVDV